MTGSTQQVHDVGDATPVRIIEAARSRLLADGYAAMSTRKVADEAGVPLSQIHYHFGGKRGLLLAMLDHEDRRLVDRQRGMYATPTSLAERYDQACDFLDEDMASGYVRVLHEMLAAGWSDTAIAEQVLARLNVWHGVLAGVVREAEERLGPLGPMTSDDIAYLIGLAFVGGEAVLLLGDEQAGEQVRGALRSVGTLIRKLEADRS